MEKDKRTHKITFRMNDEEYKIFQKKFGYTDGKSQGDFIRKMLMYGVVLDIEKEKFQNLSRNIMNTSANINQIALRVNSTGSIYAEDMEELRNDYHTLTMEFLKLKGEMSKIMPE